MAQAVTRLNGAKGTRKGKHPTHRQRPAGLPRSHGWRDRGGEPAPVLRIEAHQGKRLRDHHAGDRLQPGLPFQKARHPMERKADRGNIQRTAHQVQRTSPHVLHQTPGSPRPNRLPSQILAALAMLDPKGTDENISRAMSIVFEAFRLNEFKQSFSAEYLFASALYH